eukprot:5913471-Prymnesium_polylepis.1
MGKGGMRPCSFGCDGGVHGIEVVDSLHRVTDQKLDIVETRNAEPIEGMLLHAFGVNLVICKAKYGVVTGNLDGPHVAKRQAEQHASGVHFIQAASNVYCSWGLLRQAGVPADVSPPSPRPPPDP